METSSKGSLYSWEANFVPGRLKIKLFSACVMWFHHTLRTQTVVLTRKNALPVVLIQEKLNSEDAFHNSESVS